MQVYRADAILGKYCSDDNPPLLTSSRELTIYFHSDVSINSFGFKANYTIFDKEGEYLSYHIFPIRIYKQFHTIFSFTAMRERSSKT